MDSSSQSSAPLFGGATGAPSTDNGPATSGSSFNSLWLLFLIPIILLMLCLIAATWLIKRRRRSQRQRRSTLRNVTLVIREEEEKRDKEEKRLTRGSSIASKLGRNPSLKEERQRRYSERIARAVAREEKELGSSRGHHHPTSDSSVDGSGRESGPASSPPSSPIIRRASVKQRDREVAQRVWKVPSEGIEPALLAQLPKARTRKSSRGRSQSLRREGSRPGSVRGPTSTSAAAMDRDIEAEADTEAAFTHEAGQARHESRLPADSDDSESGGEEVITNGQHWASRRREDSNQLSVIGETGLSEGAPSADVSRDISVSGDPEVASSIPAQASTSEGDFYTPAGASGELVASAAPGEEGAAPALASYTGALAISGVSLPGRRGSTQRTPSQRSRYTTATSASHYTTATAAESTTDDDAASLRTAQTGQTVTAIPLPAEEHNDDGTAERGLTRQPSRRDSDPFTSPISPSSSGGNPFASPTQSSAGGHSALASVPTIVATSPSVRTTGLLPATAEPSSKAAEGGLAERQHEASRAESSSGGIVRKLSHVVRLRSPVPPSRARGTSPSPSQRSVSITSVAGPSRKRSPSPALTGESWAYTSRAHEWKMKREGSSSSVPTLKGLSDQTAAEGQSIPPVPAMPAEAASGRHSESIARGTQAVGLGGRQWLEPTSGYASPSTSGSHSNAPNTGGGANVQRKNSIGIAGSKFKETFN
ncbi:unnamed protein product [Parajaminaea phylloscopi]